jgi:hypothetical protein
LQFNLLVFSMVANVVKDILPGEAVSGKVVRSIPGRMIYVDVKRDSQPGNEVIALKGDHILVRDDGEVRPYRGEPFSELGLDAGAMVELIRRLEEKGISNEEFVLVAKKRAAAASAQKAMVAFTAAAAVAATAAALTFDKTGLIVAALGSMGTAVASIFKAIF